MMRLACGFSQRQSCGFLPVCAAVALTLESFMACKKKGGYRKGGKKK
jgi:hypothetical protein